LQNPDAVAEMYATAAPPLEFVGTVTGVVDPFSVPQSLLGATVDRVNVTGSVETAAPPGLVT
jgi:hypothetical protein